MAKLMRRPFWAEQALQGITYWIGHRRCLYRHYPLAEGALVAEVCNLIQANLKGPFILRCEVRYEELLPGIAKSGILTQKARADLVIVEKPKGRDKPSPKFIIEVKRATASKGQIDNDLQRLAAVRNHHRAIRAFLFIIAEAKRPNRFVNKQGATRKERYSIPNCPQNHFRVRRTCKAIHASKAISTAQYACLLEVYRHKMKR